MRARVVAWAVGWGIGLSTATASAQTLAAAFPPESAPPAAIPESGPPPAPPAPSSVASTPTPPTSPAPSAPAASTPTQRQASPNWNVGAGIFSAGDLIMESFAQSVPTYSTSLERRLGGRAWLALNARFSYSTRETAAFPTSTDPNPPRTYRVDTTTAAALLGLRYVFAHGLVDVSGFAAGYADFQHSEGQRGGLAQLGSGSKRELGLLLGMVVERELIEALALRLSLDLATASVAFEDAPSGDGTGSEQTLVTERLGLALQPGLQLHFYF